METVLSAMFHSDVMILISHRAGGSWLPSGPEKLGSWAGLVAARGSTDWKVPQGPASPHTGLGDGEARKSSLRVSSVPGKGQHR